MSNKNIQYDTSRTLIGGVNIAEAVQIEGNMFFNETYVLVGDCLGANKIHATYDLTVVGNVEATSVEVNGSLLVNGNVKAEIVRCNKLICTGKVSVQNLQCDEDLITKTATVETLFVQGVVIVSDCLNIDEKCEVERNVIAGEGVSGSGMLCCENVIAGDYFDFDGNIKANIYEIATMFECVINSKSDVVPENSEKYEKRLEKLLSEFIDSVIVLEEDNILVEIAECAQVQQISFSELYYVFCEIDRISYLKEIENLRDYFLVKYASAVLPEKFQKYETIMHVFNEMINDVEVENLEYSASSLTEFMFSLKIVLSVLTEDVEIWANKIFESIGLKYSYVNKRFERK